MEVFSIGAVFTGLIIGFIIVFAMQKFDLHSNNRNQFRQLILRLARQKPQMKEALIAYTKAYLHKEDGDALVPWLEDPSVNRTIYQLEDLSRVHVAGNDDIPNSIWYTVLISVIIISIIVVVDARMTDLMSLGAIVLIWLPIVVIYNLYIQRNVETEKIISQLLKTLAT